MSDLPVCQYRARLAPLNPISTEQLQYLIPEGEGNVYKSVFQTNVFCDLIVSLFFKIFKHNDEGIQSCKKVFVEIEKFFLLRITPRDYIN